MRVTDDVAEAGIGVTDDVGEGIIGVVVGVFEKVRILVLVAEGGPRIVGVEVMLWLGARPWLGVRVGVAVALTTATATGVKSADTATYVSPAPTTMAHTETELFWVGGAVQANLKDVDDCLELCVIPPVHLDICRK
jgi:hypothetical protein